MGRFPLEVGVVGAGWGHSAMHRVTGVVTGRFRHPVSGPTAERPTASSMRPRAVQESTSATSGRARKPSRRGPGWSESTTGGGPRRPEPGPGRRGGSSPNPACAIAATRWTRHSKGANPVGLGGRKRPVELRERPGVVAAEGRRPARARTTPRTRTGGSPRRGASASSAANSSMPSGSTPTPSLEAHESRAGPGGAAPATRRTATNRLGPPRAAPRGAGGARRRLEDRTGRTTPPMASFSSRAASTSPAPLVRADLEQRQCPEQDVPEQQAGGLRGPLET